MALSVTLIVAIYSYIIFQGRLPKILLYTYIFHLIFYSSIEDRNISRYHKIVLLPEEFQYEIYIYIYILKPLGISFRSHFKKMFHKIRLHFLLIFPHISLLQMHLQIVAFFFLSILEGFFLFYTCYLFLYL